MMGRAQRWRQFLVVLGKELTESARDRRTMLTALLLGPVGGPLLFAVMMSLGIERGQTDTREPARVAIVGEQYAPELTGYLVSAGAEVLTVPPRPVLDGGAAAAAEDALKAKRARVAIVIGPEFGARLRAGKPAPLGIYADSSDHHAEGVRSRVLHWLNAYGSGLASTRLQVRGVSPELVTPFSIDEVDVATPASRALLMLGMLSYFILLATLIGGLHIAIDMTAGERERGSLEPLLALPVARSTLVLAKLAAACVYMTLALSITLLAFGLALPHVGLEALGMRANFGPAVAARIFLVVLPFVPVGAALLTLVASALFLASLVGNPALPGTDVAGLSTRLPRGVFKVTRHPMMSSFALWGLAHMLVAPSARTIILAGGVTALAVIGSRGQDAKKVALQGNEWRTWMKRTPFLPNPAAFGHLGLYWVGAVPLWMLLTWAHLKIALIPAGVWIWLDQY